MCTPDEMDDGTSMCDDEVDGSGLDDTTEVGAAEDDDTDGLLSPPPTNASLPDTSSWNVTSLVTTRRLAIGSYTSHPKGWIPQEYTRTSCDT